MQHKNYIYKFLGHTTGYLIQISEQEAKRKLGNQYIEAGKLSYWGEL